MLDVLKVQICFGVSQTSLTQDEVAGELSSTSSASLSKYKQQQSHSHMLSSADLHRTWWSESYIKSLEKNVKVYFLNPIIVHSIYLRSSQSTTDLKCNKCAAQEMRHTYIHTYTHIYVYTRHVTLKFIWTSVFYNASHNLFFHFAQVYNHY